MKRRDFLKSVTGLVGLGLLTPKQLAELELLGEEVLEQEKQEESKEDDFPYDGTHPYAIGNTSFKIVEEDKFIASYSDDCSCEECVSLRSKSKKDGWLL